MPRKCSLFQVAHFNRPFSNRCIPCAPAGDPTGAVLAGLRAAERAFGADVNSKGFKVPRGVGVIQVSLSKAGHRGQQGGSRATRGAQQFTCAARLGNGHHLPCTVHAVAYMTAAVPARPWSERAAACLSPIFPCACRATASTEQQNTLLRLFLLSFLLLSVPPPTCREMVLTTTTSSTSCRPSWRRGTACRQAPGGVLGDSHLPGSAVGAAAPPGQVLVSAVEPAQPR